MPTFETLSDGVTYIFAVEDGHPQPDTLIRWDGPTVDIERLA